MKANDLARIEYFNHFRPAILRELECAALVRPATKDIIIVVHDQLEFLQQCLESIFQYTKDFKVYIWDNGSQQETQDYLHRYMYDERFTVLRSEKNLGFIQPNNELATWGEGDYIILLNSDTVVSENWTETMIGFLQQNPEVAEVGCMGACLDESGKGGLVGMGFDIDYVAGWCCCLSRKTYNEHGLFDPNLQIAYCEDADLSLRLQASGQQIYALHLPLVHHFENKTIKTVREEGEIDVCATFEHNHEYLRSKWANYLATQRILARQKTAFSKSSHKTYNPAVD